MSKNKIDSVHDVFLKSEKYKLCDISVRVLNAIDNYMSNKNEKNAIELIQYCMVDSLIIDEIINGFGYSEEELTRIYEYLSK